MDKLETNQPPETAEQSDAPAGQKILLFLVAGFIIVLDQLTKFIIESSLSLYEVYAPMPALEPYFRITHVFNTGAAFGFFPDGGLFFGILAVIVGFIIVYYNHTLPAGELGVRIALGLQMGGAFGNLIDRIRLGHVTDFLDFGPWPVFNVADTAIVAGAVLLGWMVLQESRTRPKAEPSDRRSTDSSPTIDEWHTS